MGLRGTPATLVASETLETRETTASVALVATPGLRAILVTQAMRGCREAEAVEEAGAVAPARLRPDRVATVARVTREQRSAEPQMAPEATGVLVETPALVVRVGWAMPGLRARRETPDLREPGPLLETLGHPAMQERLERMGTPARLGTPVRPALPRTSETLPSLSREETVETVGRVDRVETPVRPVTPVDQETPAILETTARLATVAQREAAGAGPVTAGLPTALVETEELPRMETSVERVPLTLPVPQPVPVARRGILPEALAATAALAPWDRPGVAEAAVVELRPAGPAIPATPALRGRMATLGRMARALQPATRALPGLREVQETRALRPIARRTCRGIRLSR